MVVQVFMGFRQRETAEVVCACGQVIARENPLQLRGIGGVENRVQRQPVPSLGIVGVALQHFAELRHRGLDPPRTGMCPCQ